MISKQELLEQVWHSEHVSDSAVSRCIMEARRAVGDNGAQDSLIKTIHGRGYRCVAPVEVHREDSDQPRAAGRDRSTVYFRVAAAVLLVLMAGLSWHFLHPSKDVPDTSEASPVPVVLNVAGSDTELQWLALAIRDLIRLQLAEDSGFSGIETPAGTLLVLEVEPSPIVGHARIRTLLEHQLPSGSLETSPLGTLVVPRVQPGESSDLFESVRRAVAETIVPRLLTTLDREFSSPPERREAWQLYLLAVAETGPVCDEGATAELLTRSVELEPDFAPAWTWLGGVRLMQAKFCAGRISHLAEVERAIERAIAVEPDSPIPYALRATLLTYQGRLEEASGVLAGAAERFPRSLGIRLGQSAVLRYTGDLEGSSRLFEATLEAWPALPYAAGIVPYSYRYQNDWESFLGLMTGWDSPHFRFYRGYAEQQLGNTDAAIAVLEPAFREHPGDLYGRLCQALLAVVKGDGAEARVVLGQLAHQREAEASLDGEVDFEMAELFVMAGDEQSGIQQLEAARDRGFVCAPCIESSTA
ncbi:MAG: winged helix-turn-helix domain-containing protein, partial [Thermoanaerobaculia bacterium]